MFLRICQTLNGTLRSQNHKPDQPLSSDTTSMLWFRSLLFLFAITGMPHLNAQLVSDFTPPRGSCCLQGAAQALAEQLQDWNQLGRYYADNQRLEKLPPEPGRVVFLGDSITDGWKLAQSFAAIRKRGPLRRLSTCGCKMTWTASIWCKT